jgi:hypothetical protein
LGFAFIWVSSMAPMQCLKCGHIHCSLVILLCTVWKLWSFNYIYLLYIATMQFKTPMDFQLIVSLEFLNSFLIPLFDQPWPQMTINNPRESIKLIWMDEVRLKSLINSLCNPIYLYKDNPLQLIYVNFLDMQIDHINVQ